MELRQERRQEIVGEGGPAGSDPCSPRKCVVKPGSDFFGEYTDEEAAGWIVEWDCNTTKGRLLEAVIALLPPTIEEETVLAAVTAAVADGYAVPSNDPRFPDSVATINSLDSVRIAKHLVADAEARKKYGLP